MTTMNAIPDFDEAEPSAIHNGGAQLLVIDDEPSIDRLYTQRFRREIAAGEWSFVFARNGIEALEKLRENPEIAVALVDLNMPQMDGLTFLGELEKLNLPTKAVVVSAYGDMKNIRAAMNRGAFDFLCKPIDFADVETTIRKTLRYVNDIRDSRRSEEFCRAKETAELNLKRMEELDELRTSLTSLIVHELRTPMTSYLGGLEVMEMWGDLSPRQQECLHISMRGGATLLAMVSDLLDINKMEAALLHLELRDLQLPEIVEEILRQVEPLATQCDLQLKSVVAPNLPTLRADDDKLKRTLVNLLSNSIKFTPKDGEIVLTTALGENGQSIAFTVSDNGYEVPADQRERIFEKYGQVEDFKKAHKITSSGLGLTFCRMVVEAHGGRIWVESEEDKGSRFILNFPLEGAPAIAS